MEIADGRLVHQKLLSRLMCGPGDSEGAMRRAESMFGLPYWCQWNLRHKRRASGVFLERLRQAYLATLENSVRRELRELEIEHAKGDADAVGGTLMAEAQALLEKIQTRRVRA